MLYENRVLALFVEHVSWFMSRVSSISEAGGSWVGLGVAAFFVCGLFLIARALHRKLTRPGVGEAGEEEPVRLVEGTVGNGRHEEPILASSIGTAMERPCGEVDWSVVPKERSEILGDFGVVGDGLVARLRERLVRTRGAFVGRVDQVLFERGRLTEEVLDELEEVLVTADLGFKTSCELLEEVRREIGRERAGPERVREALKEKVGTLLSPHGCRGIDLARGRPFVILLVGVNGVGKTTTAGKLAAILATGGRKVMLVAADTFRPAAIEQLQTWAERVGADFIRHQTGADPSAVVFDAIQSARSRNTDVVLVDTAGRLHTKRNLMDELRKINRVIGKELTGAPHETFLVVDATTGQNAIQQAKVFHEALCVTGLVLTKLDGTAKGGVIVGVSNELQVPVRYVGIGERVEDLQVFVAPLFLEAMFGSTESNGAH